MTEEEYNTMWDFEEILRDASFLTAVCQNEDKLNGAYGPVVCESLYYSLSGEPCV